MCCCGWASGWVGDVRWVGGWAGGGRLLLRERGGGCRPRGSWPGCAAGEVQPLQQHERSGRGRSTLTHSSTSQAPAAAQSAAARSTSAGSISTPGVQGRGASRRGRRWAGWTLKQLHRARFVPPAAAARPESHARGAPDRTPPTRGVAGVSEDHHFGGRRPRQLSLQPVQVWVTAAARRGEAWVGRSTASAPTSSHQHTRLLRLLLLCLLTCPGSAAQTRRWRRRPTSGPP